MQTLSAQVTAAEIARLAGVTRATVSNWRRRHPDFPAPIGGTDASPGYDLDSVKRWLAARGQLPASTPADELREALRAAEPERATPEQLLPLVLATTRLDAGAVAALAGQPPSRLVQRCQQLARAEATELPWAERLTYDKFDVPVLQALLHTAATAGPIHVAETVASRAGEVSSGTYETPAALAELMADLLTEPDGGYPSTVLDPACGAGNLLVAAARRKGAGPGTATVYGQDVVPSQTGQAAVRLAVAVPKAGRQLRAGDSLRDDAFAGLLLGGVICAPPYGDREWGYDELAYDPRWVYGLPPRGESELAWVQHCLSHLTPGGRAVLLLTPSTADRPAGKRIRAELIRAGVLRGVVALPPRIATPLHVGLHLWLLQVPGSPAKNVLFVDATRADAGELGRVVVESWREHVTAPETVTPVPGLARAVPAMDLLDDVVDLNPVRHCHVVEPTDPREQAVVADELRSRLGDAMALLATATGGIHVAAAGKDARSWRTASVADLVRGGAVTLLRAQPTSRAEHAIGDITIEPGDVIVPDLVTSRAFTVRVATADDAGTPLSRAYHLLRPDPKRLDPWFLAGFLGTAENLHAASTGSSVVRVDVRRLRVPLMLPPEQRRYSAAFRRLAALRDAAAMVGRLADDTAQALAAGLTAGTLTPETPDPPAAKEGQQ